MIKQVQTSGTILVEFVVLDKEEKLDKPKCQERQEEVLIKALLVKN